MIPPAVDGGFDFIAETVLGHVLAEGDADRALLFEYADRGVGATRLNPRFEVTGPGVAPVSAELRGVTDPRVSEEYQALASGHCFFRYVPAVSDPADRNRLVSEAVTAVAAFPLRIGGQLAGFVSTNWTRGQTVDRDRAHIALSDAALALAPLLDEGASL